MALSDIAIAQAATLKPNLQLAHARLGIPPEALEPYGHYKAKIDLNWLAAQSHRPDGKLVLVTAISPTPAGEGKTTTSIGLADALTRLGKKAVAVLREPSLGPVFGLKGGATGGGRARDSNNPDPKLRSRPIEGLVILSDFKDAGGEWEGKIYDPRAGKTYRSTMVKQPDGS
ncbi:MAG: hypothetical protein CFE32_23195 [Alphaproteobacteria bacterium PA3]|nr:MAG: hypothetical protein CFE32_23195 [Alphaproteobacteria bacterium PA3]